MEMEKFLHVQYSNYEDFDITNSKIFKLDDNNCKNTLFNDNKMYTKDDLYILLIKYINESIFLEGRISCKILEEWPINTKFVHIHNA